MMTISVICMLYGYTGCTDPGNKTQHILSRAEMVRTLTEIYLSEQRINRLGLPRDSAEYQFEFLKHVIFERAGVSDSVFKNSFDYYMDRPKEMERIYTALVDSLSLMERRIESSARK
jgi:hypothetical protein